MRLLKQLAVFMLVFSLLITGCGKKANDKTTDNTTDAAQTEIISDNKVSESVQINTSDAFSGRDQDSGYSTDTAASILLNGNSAVCTSDAVVIEENTVTITDEGTYILQGALENGMVIVNADKQDKVQLVLSGAEVNCDTSAALYILQADKVFVTLDENTENYLTNGGTFEAVDENNIDGAVFSKEDITFNGSGFLGITSPAGHGIVSKDSLTITDGAFEINCAAHGLNGKDEVCTANADITIISGKDGIHAENKDDAAGGYVYIESGIYSITAEGDGISAASSLQIDDGVFNIVSGGGSENAEVQTSENWGMMGPGGPGGHGGGFGGKGHGGGMMGDPFRESSTDDTSEDSTSIKGIKSSGEMTINSGVFNLNCADDAFHSNTSMLVSGGEFTISSGDDAFHADETLTVNSGVINISECYEGLEALNICVNGGDITLVASDDGINAAGGTDQSGFGGFRGNDLFGMGSSDGTITITGGALNVTAYGDGIDANGSVLMSGGLVTVCGPTQGDTATLDYDVTAEITGGTFIGTGANGMAQTFSHSSQGLISVSTGNQNAGTKLMLCDAEGNIIIEHTPELSYAIVIISTPDIISSQTYTLYVGSQSGEVTAE